MATSFLSRASLTAPLPSLLSSSVLPQKFPILTRGEYGRMGWGCCGNFETFSAPNDDEALAIFGFVKTENVTLSGK